MNIVPVLDLLNGIVVRGVAGRRSDYQPLRSSLTTSVQPLDVARALRTAFGFTKFYVADLDAILHQSPGWSCYRQLIADGFQLLVDAGIQSVEQSLLLRDCGAEPIIGLESCPSPRVLAEIVAALQGEITFSVDLQDGRPLLSRASSEWSVDPRAIVRQSVECGVTRMIVLDLADVGTFSGGRTEQLCRSLLLEFPSLELTCGGGVRGVEDLRRLELAGASAVLVASALHDGRLSALAVPGISAKAPTYPLKLM
jgi:phosphoribosylformimino-5-aminoimidazole carboxamide ribotide isomerase